MPRRTIIVMDARKPKHGKKKPKKHGKSRPNVRPHRGDPDTDPDWTRSCSNCGQSPIVPVTGLCGPCTFGEADTIDGNW